MSDDQTPASDLARDLLRRTTGAPPAQRRQRSGASRRKVTEVTYSASGHDSRDPAVAGDIVDELLDSQGWRKNTEVAAAMARWDQIAGPELAAHVSAESFVDGVLTLQADSTSWATQMRLLMPSIRQAIDAAVGRGVVTDIRINGPQPPRSRGAWRVRGRGPRDTYG